MDKGHRRGGIVGPLVLIAVGAILLFNNLNLTDISLVELGLKLWPALIIAAGLDLLIPRNSWWSSVLALGLIAAVLVGSYWVFGAIEQDRAVEGELSYPVANVSQAQITLDPSVGELTVTGGAPQGILVHGSFSGRGSGEPLVEANVEDGQANFGLRQDWQANTPLDFSQTSLEWNLELSDRIPTSLSANLGVGSLRLDARQLDVGSLAINVGIGSTRIRLPAGQAPTVAFDGGIGALDIELPPQAAVELRIDRGLATLQLPPGYVQEGDIYRSAAAETADEPIQIAIDIGIGSVRLYERQ